MVQAAEKLDSLLQHLTGFVSDSVCGGAAVPMKTRCVDLWLDLCGGTDRLKRILRIVIETVAQRLKAKGVSSPLQPW